MGVIAAGLRDGGGVIVSKAQEPLDLVHETGRDNECAFRITKATGLVAADGVSRPRFANVRPGSLGSGSTRFQKRAHPENGGAFVCLGRSESKPAGLPDEELKVDLDETDFAGLDAQAGDLHEG